MLHLASIQVGKLSRAFQLDCPLSTSSLPPSLFFPLFLFPPPFFLSSSIFFSFSLLSSLLHQLPIRHLQPYLALAVRERDISLMFSACYLSRSRLARQGVFNVLVLEKHLFNTSPRVVDGVEQIHGCCRRRILS